MTWDRQLATPPPKFKCLSKGPFKKSKREQASSHSKACITSPQEKRVMAHDNEERQGGRHRGKVKRQEGGPGVKATPHSGHFGSPSGSPDKYLLLSLLCQEVQVLQHHPTTEQRCREKGSAHRHKTDTMCNSPFLRSSQAYLLSWWSVWALGSLHPRKSNDPL